MKINILLTKQKESDEKIASLEKTVDKLFAENVKINTDMKILRDEHTEVLHSMFQYEKNNSTLNQENAALKNLINSTVNQTRTEIPEDSYIQSAEPNAQASMVLQTNPNSHLNTQELLNPPTNMHTDQTGRSNLLQNLVPQNHADDGLPPLGRAIH